MKKGNSNYIYYRNLSDKCDKLNQQHVSINDKLIGIENSINSNAFTSIFVARGKKRIYLIIKFLFSLLIMFVAFILIFRFFYNNMNLWDKTLEIFGNGFFWILAVVVYQFVSKFVDDIISIIKKRSVNKNERY